jgi:hypothetical protein
LHIGLDWYRINKTIKKGFKILDKLSKKEKP